MMSLCVMLSAAGVRGKGVLVVDANPTLFCTQLILVWGLLCNPHLQSHALCCFLQSPCITGQKELLPLQKQRKPLQGLTIAYPLSLHVVLQALPR